MPTATGGRRTDSTRPPEPCMHRRGRTTTIHRHIFAIVFRQPSWCTTAGVLQLRRGIRKNTRIDGGHPHRISWGEEHGRMWASGITRRGAIGRGTSTAVVWRKTVGVATRPLRWGGRRREAATAGPVIRYWTTAVAPTTPTGLGGGTMGTAGGGGERRAGGHGGRGERRKGVQRQSWDHQWDEERGGGGERGPRQRVGVVQDTWRRTAGRGRGRAATDLTSSAAIRRGGRRTRRGCGGMIRVRMGRGGGGGRGGGMGRAEWGRGRRRAWRWTTGVHHGHGPW